MTLHIMSQEAVATLVASALPPLIEPPSASPAASFNEPLSFLTTESAMGPVPVLLFLVSGLLMGVDFVDDTAVTSLGVVVGGAALGRAVDFIVLAAGAFPPLAGVAIGVGFDAP
jgi:hypothetical protein